MSTHKMGKAILMSIRNMGFYEDLTKIIFQLSSKYAPNISSSGIFSDLIPQISETSRWNTRYACTFI